MRNLIFLLLLVLAACNNQNNSKRNITQANSSVNDSLFERESKITSGSLNKESNSCQFDKWLNDPKTPKLAKDIYIEKNWNLGNDKEALALLDSLTANDITSRPFYFKVISKSYRKADGYFSEGLGVAGKDYVENNTKEFASIFENKTCFTDIDLAIWANIVILEFSMIEEREYNRPIIDDFVNKLKVNCKDCSTSQKETINKFGVLLKGKWQEFLKNIDK